MAKKGLIDFDNTNADFDNDDFGDFGFDMRPPRQPKNAREAIAQAAPSVLEGFKDSAMDPNNIRRMAEKALPKSFSYALSEVDDYAASYGDLSRSIGKEIRPTVTAMTKVAQRVNKVLPHPLQGKLDAYFTRKLATGDKRQEVDAEEAAIQAMMADGGMGGGEDGPGSLTNDKRAEDAITKIDERNYRVKMFQSVSEMRDAVLRQSQYTFTQQRQYQRKLLEVQIRQLVTQRKHLELSSRAAVEVSSLLRDVVKNTGLPEFAKEHANESFRRTAREMMFGKIQRPIANWSQNYLRGVTKNYTGLFKRRMESLKRGSEMASDQFDMVKDAMSQAEQFGESKLSVLGGLSGDALFEFLGSMGAEKLKKLFPDAGKVDNLFSYIARSLKGAKFKTSKWGAKANGTSFKDELRRGLYVGYDKDENQVVRGSGLGSINGLDYESRSTRALEEIIPGYLSRILHSIDVMRTGDDGLPRTVWSREKGSFTTVKESTSRLERAILSKGKVANQASDVQELMTSMGVGESDHALRAKLGQHLMTMSSTATGFDPEGLVNGPVDGMTKREQNRLSKILKRQYGLTFNAEKGEWVSGLKAKNKAILESQDRYGRVQRSNNNIYNNVQAAVNTGSLEELVQMGAVHWDEAENAWVISEGYVSGRRKQAMAESITKSRTDRLESRKPSDAIKDRVKDTVNPLGGAAGNAGGNISGRGVKSITRAIETQTEQLLDSFHELIGLTGDNYDVLADIYDQIGQGVTVNGYGYKPGMIGRGLGRAGRGAMWAGKKLWKATGAPFRAARWAGKKLMGGLGNPIANWYKGKDIRGAVNRFMTDVYVFGEQGLRKALDAAGFKEGRYTNMTDGSPIKSLRDIKGAVYDTLLKKQVISQEEYESGLLNSVGKRIMAGPWGAVGAGLRKGYDLLTSPFRAMWRAGKASIRTTMSTFMAPPDIYVRGESTPRILGDLMYKGTYYSGMTGKVLKYLGDVDGEIVTFDRLTGERRVIITLEEVQQGLVDASGKPLTPFFRKIRNLITAGKNLVKGVLKAPGKVLGWAKNKLKALGGMMGNAMDKLFQGRDNKLSQVFWLERIYKLLYTKFTGGTVSKSADLAGAMNSISGAAERAASKVGATAKDVFDKLKPDAGESWMDNIRRRGRAAKDKAASTKAGQTMQERLGLITGSAAMARAKDAKDDLIARSGSWLEQMRTKASDKLKEARGKGEEKKAEGKSFLGGLLSSVGGMMVAALGGLFAKIMGKLAFIKPALTKLIPNTLMKMGRMIAMSKAAGGVEDALIDGPGKRKGAKWLRRLKASKVGRWAGRLAPWVGRGAIAAAGTAGAGAASAATAAAGSVAAGAAAAGGAAAAAGTSLLGMAGAALTAIGSVVFSPVVLGIAAGAAALYGGYKLYQYFKKKSSYTVAERVRLVEYGFQLESQSDVCAKALALEALFQPALVWREGKVGFDTKKIDMQEIASLFGVQMTQGQQFARVSGWLTKRFMPIYQSWLMAGKRCANLDSIDKLDSRVSPAILLQIIRGSFLADLPAESSPYNVDQSPVPGYYITQGVERIQAAIRTAETELSTNVRQATKDSRIGQPLGAREGFTPPPSSVLRRPSILPAATPGVSSAVDDYYGAAERLTKGKITGNTVSDDLIAKFNQIDDMTALRMKVYGLATLHKVYVDILTRFEKELYKHVTWSPNGAAVLDFATPSDIYLQYAPMFSLDPTDKEAAQIFVYWVSKRFLPAYTTYLAACHKVDANGDPFTAYGRFKGEELLAVARATSQASTRGDNNQMYSVWNVDASPFPNEHANLKSSFAAVNLAAFEAAVKADTYSDSKVSARTRLTTAGATRLSQQAANLMSDMAAATGNQSSYQYRNVNTNGYTSQNNISTSWTSAGFEGQEVSNVKLEGDAKSRGESLMKMALAAGLAGDELALFMGTCAQETGDFNSYREKGANIAAYASNKALGNNSAADAAKYIGRGPIQMTGLANYQNATAWLQKDGINVDFVNNPEKMEDPYYGGMAALAYWKNYLRPLVARKGRQLDPLTVSAATNGWYEDPSAQGGLRTPNGYDVRLRKIMQWRKIINGEAPDPTMGDDAKPATPVDPTKVAAPGPNSAGAPTGGQATAPAPGGTASSSPVAAGPSAALAPGQAVAPPMPQSAPTPAYRTTAAPSTPSAGLTRAPAAAPATAYQQRQAVIQQQSAQQQVTGPNTNSILTDQLVELRAIKQLLSGGAAVPKPAQEQARVNPSAANSTPSAPLSTTNSNSNVAPNASAASAAPATAQPTATEAALASPRPASSQPSQQPMPFNVNI